MAAARAAIESGTDPEEFDYPADVEPAKVVEDDDAMMDELLESI